MNFKKIALARWYPYVDVSNDGDVYSFIDMRMIIANEEDIDYRIVNSHRNLFAKTEVKKESKIIIALKALDYVSPIGMFNFDTLDVELITKTLKEWEEAQIKKFGERFCEVAEIAYTYIAEIAFIESENSVIFHNFDYDPVSIEDIYEAIKHLT